MEIERLEGNTFRSLVTRYDLSMIKEIKSSTKKSNRDVFQVLGFLYDINIQDLTEDLIYINVFDHFLNYCEMSYINKIRSYLNKVFNWAVKKELMIKNPIHGLSRFKEPDALKKSVDYYLPSEWEKWDLTALRHLRNNPNDLGYYMFINILYFMGMRPGEVRALKIEDVEGNYIRIDKTCTTVNKSEHPLGFIITPPKTLNSYRTIEMPSKLKQRMRVYLKHLDSIYQNHRGKFLFGGNHPLHTETVRRKFQRIAKNSGIPVYKPYALRHTHASILINGGALDYEVARRLGHSVQELRITYAHLFKTTEGHCISIMDKVHETETVGKNSKENLGELLKESMKQLGIKDENGIFYCAYESKKKTKVWKYDHNEAIDYVMVGSGIFEGFERNV